MGGFDSSPKNMRFNGILQPRFKFLLRVLLGQDGQDVMPEEAAAAAAVKEPEEAEMTRGSSGTATSSMRSGQRGG